MLAYKRPFWVWLLILVLGGLVAFAGYWVRWQTSSDQYVFYTAESVRGVVVDRETYELFCNPQVSSEIGCEVNHKPTVTDSAIVGGLTGFLGLLIGHWAARKGEKEIERLYEFINEYEKPRK